MTAEEIFDFYSAKGVMSHTNGLTAYAWVNLLRDSDDFLFSNSVQFSQVGHIQEFRDQLARLYSEDWSFQEFARWSRSCAKGEKFETTNINFGLMPALGYKAKKKERKKLLAERAYEDFTPWVDAVDPVGV